MAVAGAGCASGGGGTGGDGLRALQDAADATLSLPSFAYQLVRADGRTRNVVTGEYEAPDRWHERHADGADVIVMGERRCEHLGSWPPESGYRCREGRAEVERLFAALEEAEAVRAGGGRLVAVGVPVNGGRGEIEAVVRDGRIVRLGAVRGTTRHTLRILDPGLAPPIVAPACATDDSGTGPPACPAS